MTVRVVLSIDVATDLTSSDDIINHIDFNKLVEGGDDVVDVNYVDVENIL